MTGAFSFIARDFSRWQRRLRVFEWEQPRSLVGGRSHTARLRAKVVKRLASLRLPRTGACPFSRCLFPSCLGRKALPKLYFLSLKKK